jgi:two-component system response regulator HydG
MTALERAARLAAQGRRAHADRVLLRAMARGRRDGGSARAEAMHVALALAEMRLDAGRARSAGRVLDVPLLDSHGARPVALDVLAGVALTDLDRLDEAEARLRPAVMSSAAGREWAFEARLALGRCVLWQGRHRELAGLLDEEGSCRASPVARARWWRLQARVARVEVRDPRLERLALGLEQALEEPALRGSTRAARILRRELALTCAWLGDRDGLEHHLRLAWLEAGAERRRLAGFKLRLARLEGFVALECLDDAMALGRLLAARGAQAVTPLLWRRAAQLVAAANRAGRRRPRASGARRRGGSRLRPVQSEATVVGELVDILRLCQATDDPAPALARVCEAVRARLGARHVAVWDQADARPLATCGRPGRAAGLARDRTALHSAYGAGDAGGERRVPIVYRGEAVASLHCGWPDAQGGDAAAVFLEAVAAACAPLVHELVAWPHGAVAGGDAVLGIVGAGAAIRAVQAAIRRAAAVPFAVLVEGESGSGKELVARAIHASGPRRQRRFCAINCAAFSDELVEAELFGHARGAFTGAVAERTGLFEEASGGTLFLDELAELSVRAQAKLLRALQDGEIRRVGENVARRVDARVVAATNRSLAAEVAAGRFRHDLRYRVEVIRIVVPPLRDRREDIPVLAAHAWRRASEQAGTRATLDTATLAALSRYDWPGNVRELQNVVAQLAVHAPRRGVVTPALLPEALQVEAGLAAGPTLDAVRRRVEADLVREALARTGGRRAEAARALGLSRQGLAKLMTRLGIDVPGLPPA